MTSFNEYVNHGWVLCPIAPGGKAPKGQDAVKWQTREKGITDPTRALGLIGAGLCHAWSGTCALDIDEIDVARDYLAAEGIDLDALIGAPDSVQIVSGKVGRAKLLYALPDPLPSKQLAPYQKLSAKTNKMQTYHGFELRCANSDGQTVQDVLPPTMHPETGREYRWVFGDDLIGHWKAPPLLPEALKALWIKSAQAASPSPAAGPQAPVGAEASEISALLAGKDPDCDYQEWIRIGAAVHHETKGSDTGFRIWDAWSAKGSKYKSSHDLIGHWRSFRSDAVNAVTLGGLRAEQVSKVEEFPIIEAEGEQEDGRVDPMMQRLVGDKLVYVREMDRYFHLGFRHLFLSDRAVRNAFLPDIPYVMGGDKPKKPDPISWLMASTERRNKDVAAIGMHPGEGVTYEEGGRRYANCFPPQKVVEPLAPTPFELEAFQFIWSRMADVRFQAWLMKFYAYALKHPGVKIQTAPLLVSETQGTGKSTIMSAIPRLLFGDVLEYSESQLRSPYNGELLNAWWVTFEEVYAGATKTDRRYVTDKVKPWITNPTLSIHPKGLQAITIPNRIQFTASSNHMDALQLEDDEDRRWGVCGVAEMRYTPNERRDIYQGFLNTPRAAGVLKHIFQNVSLTGFYPSGEAPKTRTKTLMVEVGRGQWETAIQEKWENAEAPFDRDIFSIRDIRQMVFGSQGPNPVQVGRILAKAPFNFKQLSNCGTQRLYCQRNFDGWSRVSQSARLDYTQTGTRPTYIEWDPEISAEFQSDLL